MKSITLDGVKLYPSKIVCIGQNYVEHIRELGNEMPDEPVIFLKPNSAITADIQSLDNEVLHYEGELAFVIIGGEFTGVGFGLDLTKRAVQARLRDKGMPWERSKAFDGAAVFSDFVRIDGGLENLRLELWINGQLIQDGGYELMMNKPADILAEVGAFMSLEDGDVILSGTPKGVGEVNAGDRFHGKVFGGGSLLVEKAWTVR
jgi:2-keto-4-pentenoate hydratase/2-oxohepta-3-ene-1,7-dioic acid hydratase in catechol pathway